MKKADEEMYWNMKVRDDEVKKQNNILKQGQNKGPQKFVIAQQSPQKPPAGILKKNMRVEIKIQKKSVSSESSSSCDDYFDENKDASEKELSGDEDIDELFKKVIKKQRGESDKKKVVTHQTSY